MIILKSCPFCGSPAQLRYQDVYNVHSARVSCTRCTATSMIILEGTSLGYGGKPAVTRTLEQCEKEASKYWNRRAGSNIISVILSVVGKPSRKSNFERKTLLELEQKRQAREAVKRHLAAMR
jgi:restriction alleviation protein, Lar family